MNIKCFRETALPGTTCSQVSETQIGSPAPAATQQTIHLQPQQVWKITIQAGIGVKVTRGICWLTVSGQSDDIILRPTQAWNASRKTELLLSALAKRACELEIIEYV